MTTLRWTSSTVTSLASRLYDCRYLNKFNARSSISLLDNSDAAIERLSRMLDGLMKCSQFAARVLESVFVSLTHSS